MAPNSCTTHATQATQATHADLGARQHGSKNLPLLSFFKNVLVGRSTETKFEDASGGHRRGGGRRVSAVEVEAPTEDARTLEYGHVYDAAPGKPAPVDFGYLKNLETRFDVLEEIARGGNGIIRLVRDKRTLQKYAMKCIPKVLTDPSVSERKREDHPDAVRREVDVLKRMRGVLNVASLEAVYEDDDTVYMVMEYCTGGELVHVIGEAHYTEQTVASFLRATLRTLAQCHANGILHRDIKPGNFLLASDKEDAPLKAIDFGLAAFVEGDGPVTDLGLEGTPWFMAPETLSNQVYKASDVWAAGVMAYQLLTGKFPFNDKRNPYEPALSQVWKSILMDPLNMSDSRWENISPEARDFVASLLDKDPMKRPTAQQALKHPWLLGTIKDRHKGTPLSLAVVQRIQRFSQASVFKRSVLELIAEELVAEDMDDDTDMVDIGERGKDTRPRADSCPLGDGTRALITHPDSSALEYLYTKLKLVDRTIIDRKELANGLNELGYRLTDSEVEQLLDALDSNNTGSIGKTQISASQIDWRVLQRNNTRRWVERARRVFSALDKDGDGVLSSAEITNLLASKLPPAEVEGALRHAMMEASRRKKKEEVGKKEEDLKTEASLHDGLRFHQFLRILSAGSMDSLDQYEDKLGSPLVYSMLRSIDSKSSMNDISIHDIDRVVERSLSVHGMGNAATPVGRNKTLE